MQIIAIEQETDLASLIEEAMNDFLAKHKKNK